MRKNLLTWVVLGSLASAATVVHADMTVVQSALAATPTNVGFVVNFSGLTLVGFEFSQITGLPAGSLTSVSINATLDASEAYTYANDLTIYVDPAPLSTGGLLQVGGFSNLSAAETHEWGNGGSDAPGTTVIDTVMLTTPISFAGTTADPLVWLGNGYGDPDASGTWTGSITLNITPVPEPSSWALFAAGGVGLMAWMARRRRDDMG